MPKSTAATTLKTQHIKPTTLNQKENRVKVPNNLTNNVKQCFGRELIINYIERPAENKIKVHDLVYKYAKPNKPKKFEFPKVRVSHRAELKPAGYVQVYYPYWEQITMNTRAFLALAWQAKLGGRKLVQTMVKDSGFKREGHSLGIYFDLTHLNSMLKASEYAALAKRKEFKAECLLANANHVIVHFLYKAKNAEQNTRKRFRLSKKQYNNISQNAKAKGWTDCSFIGEFVKMGSDSKFICVDPFVITEWTRLESEVVRGAKCLTILIWRGIGGSFRTYFSAKGAKVSARDLQFTLKPNAGIYKEVEKFKKAFLRGPYIGVHIRGEKVVIRYSLERLRKCLHLLVEVIQVLKESSNITQVLIVSDMSDYGSGSWKGSLKNERHDDNTLKNLRESLISSTGGVVYAPSADSPDRGVVALVEMTLISQAQHLIRIGEGSFQEWIVARFLEQYRDHSNLPWSLITMCSK